MSDPAKFDDFADRLAESRREPPITAQELRHGAAVIEEEPTSALNLALARMLRTAADTIESLSRRVEQGEADTRRAVLAEVRAMIEESIRAFLAEERAAQARGEEDAGHGYVPFHLQRLAAKLDSLTPDPAKETT